jgi:hypothetical protein
MLVVNIFQNLKSETQSNLNIKSWILYFKKFGNEGPHSAALI